MEHELREEMGLNSAMQTGKGEEKRGGEIIKGEGRGKEQRK